MRPLVTTLKVTRVEIPCLQKSECLIESVLRVGCLGRRKATDRGRADQQETQRNQECAALNREKRQFQNDSCVMIPLPSWMTTSRLAGTCSSVSSAPPSHRIRKRASLAAPKPKCSRRSFCEQKLPPLRTSCTWRRFSASTTTREPMAARLVLVPISLTSSHELDGGDWLRSKEG